jgi:DNA-binding Lrp family transcriptional regulator
MKYESDSVTLMTSEYYEAPLDAVDRRIIAALQRDAELSNKELAAKAGLAPSSCLERVRRLRAAKVLRGAQMHVDPKALGVGLEAVIGVRLRHHQEREVDAWYQQLRKHPEVVGLYYISGDVDFLVHVAVRDVEHLRSLGVEAFTSHRIVAHVDTSIIFEQWKHRPLPDLALERERRKATGDRR